jgi:predicted GNAT family N-acyltransferase
MDVPRKSPAHPAAPGRVRVKLAESPAEWVGAVAVRLAVFVDEQGVPLSAELDEHDRSAVHAVAVVEDGPSRGQEELLLPARRGAAARAPAQAGKYLPLSLTGARGGLKDVGEIAAAVGTGRLLRGPAAVARIGRVSVLPAWRGYGVGSRILRLLEEAALARGAARIELHAQVPVQQFYLRHGYGADAPGCVFLEDGIPHVAMSKHLSFDM